MITLMNIAQLNFWSQWWLFVVFHDVSTVRFFDWILYGLAAIVQIIKIFNFIAHYGGHNNREKHNKSHKLASLIGLCVSIVSLALIITNMWLLSYYERIGAKFIDLYNILSVVVMVPLLHNMILNQEVQGQRSIVKLSLNNKEETNSYVANNMF